MKYLLDTNIWLEVLLGQNKADSVRQFIQLTDSTQLAITDFSLFSIGIILLQLKKDNVYQEFITDILENANVTRLHLESDELKILPVVAKEYNLDFDDAYQYLASEKYDLILVSFDSDFDSTPRKRKSPEEFLPSE